MPCSTEVRTALETYAGGPDLLRSAVSGLTAQQVRQPVPPGRWSVLEVVCHLADFEIVYADRMKRILAEDRPTLWSGDPDCFAARLHYSSRDLENELTVITSLRRQMTCILQAASPDDFERTGLHSADGPLSLLTLLQRIARHIPHHVDFIVRKRPALQA